MSFDFTAAFKEAEQDLSNNKLFVITLGQSGGGKSRLLGTFGVKTAYLYFQGESHGPKSAKQNTGALINGICLDRAADAKGVEIALTADESLKRLNDILDDVAGLKKAGIGAIALDGVSELEGAIRGSDQFKKGCMVEGKHNGFAEGGVTLAILRPIFNKLKKLQRELGVHVGVSCILEIKEIDEDGLIQVATPKLLGYQVPSWIIPQFDDVIVVGRIQKGDLVTHRIQTMAGVGKESKDFVTKAVKKTFNFHTRVTGVDLSTLAAKDGTLKADLSKLVEAKAGGK